MISAARLFAIFDEAKQEAVEAVERPAEDMRTEYGFGRMSGVLQVLRELRERVEAAIEAEENTTVEEPEFES